MTRSRPSSSIRWLVVGFVVLALGGSLFLAWFWWQRRPLARNVVVVLVDTLRADHLSLYGYERATSPNLDRIARDRGVVFENVRSQAPCTFPSANSLLTSRSAANFVRSGRNDFSIPREIPSIAAILRRRGYSTVAVSASPIVRATPSPENPSAGFGEGFDQFDESCYWSNAPCVTYRARDHLEKLTSPFFLLLHYMDPHDPYRLSRPEEQHFAGVPPDGRDREALLAGDPNPFAARLYEEGGESGLEPAGLRFLVDRYDDEIRSWDRWFDALVTDLGQRGRLEDTLIVVVSDHGEEFLEHGDLKHCRNLFDTSVRVPMIWIVPRISAKRLEVPVTNLDLVPTLLDLVGAPSRETWFEGDSLRRWMTGRRPPSGARVQTSWWGDQRMVSDGIFKLLSPDPEQRPALYRLDVDPRETADRSLAERAAVARLRSALEAWRGREPDGGGVSAEKLEAELRALGYLQ